MAAGRPTDESRARHPWWGIAAGLLALLLLAGLTVLWIKAPAMYGTGDAAKNATATTRASILTVTAALIAATAAGAGLYFTARTVRVNQQTLIETRRANREADRRDRYAKAIEQLGHDKAPVRLGAMYSLERLAQDNLDLRQSVVDVLCAYLRMPFKLAKRPESSTESRVEGTGDTSLSDATDQESEQKTVQELLVRQTAQRLLAGHLRPPPGTSGVDAQDIEASSEVTFWPDSSLDLTEANLVGLDLSNTSVVHAAFSRATFSGDARFAGTTFSRDPTLALVQVLHIDDDRLKENRKWPTGWTVCPDADDPTRGTLVRRGSDS